MAAYDLHQIQLTVEDAFPFPPPEYDLAFRRMFGGLGLYVRGRIFAIVMDSFLDSK